MTVSTPPRALRIRPSWRLGLAVCLTAALSAALALVLDAGQRPAVVTLSIVGTTDLHGYVFPREGRGGLAVFGGYLANLRAARLAGGGGLVLLDAGDTWLGGIESNMSEGAVVVDAYNALGYTAAALGNHDLEFGAEDRWPFGTAEGDLRGALKARARQARYPMLAANLIDETTGAPVAWPNVTPSTLVTVAGLRVGIVGVMTYDALSLTLRANVGGLVTAPLVRAIADEARALRAGGAQVVVVTAHAGGGCSRFEAPEDLSSCDENSEIFDVARRLPPGLVDAIVAGHTHDALAHRVAGIPIVQAYSWGRAFGRVDLRVHRATGTVETAQVFAPQEICAWYDGATNACAPAPSPATRPAVYEGRDVVASAAVSEAMRAGLQRVGAWRAAPLDVSLDRALARGPGDAESPLGNLFADALAAAVPGVDGALSYGAGPGGLRADLGPGPVTLGALYDVFPFDNRVVTLSVTGADLRALLLDHLRRPRWRARALGVSGLHVTLDCHAGGDAVEVVRASGRRVEDGERLTLAMTDFLAARAERLAAPAAVSVGPQVRDAVLGWVRSRPALAAGAFAVAGTPRWARTDASAAGCVTPVP